MCPPMSPAPVGSMGVRVGEVEHKGHGQSKWSKRGGSKQSKDHGRSIAGDTDMDTSAARTASVQGGRARDAGNKDE